MFRMTHRLVAKDSPASVVDFRETTRIVTNVQEVFPTHMVPTNAYTKATDYGAVTAFEAMTPEPDKDPKTKKVITDFVKETVLTFTWMGVERNMTNSQLEQREINNFKKLDSWALESFEWTGASGKVTGTTNAKGVMQLNWNSPPQ